MRLPAGQRPVLGDVQGVVLQAGRDHQGQPEGQGLRDRQGRRARRREVPGVLRRQEGGRCGQGRHRRGDGARGQLDADLLRQRPPPERGPDLRELQAASRSGAGRKRLAPSGSSGAPLLVSMRGRRIDRERDDLLTASQVSPRDQGGAVMRGRPFKLMMLVALLTPVVCRAAATCDSQVDKAASKLAQAVAKRAAAACKKTPGGTCFNVSAPAIKGKALKKCDAAALQTKFNGKCPSRDSSCAPSAVGTADQAAQCLSCSIQSDVRCLAATAFAPGSLPANCRN